MYANNDLTDEEIEQIDANFTDAVAGYFFKTTWPDDYKCAVGAVIDTALNDNAYIIVTSTDIENQFYLHAVHFSVNSGQITNKKFFRKVYKTEKGRDNKAKSLLTQT